MIASSFLLCGSFLFKPAPELDEISGGFTELCQEKSVKIMGNLKFDTRGFYLLKCLRISK